MEDVREVPCRTCNGARVMMRLGGMYGDCDKCRGSGWERLYEKPKISKDEVRRIIEEIKEESENVVDSKVAKFKSKSEK